METFLERFDSGLKEGKIPERVEWEAAFPGRGVAVGTPVPAKSAPGNHMQAVSGALSNKLGECGEKGKKGRGPEQFRPGVEGRSRGFKLLRTGGPDSNAMQYT